MKDLRLVIRKEIEDVIIHHMDEHSAYSVADNLSFKVMESIKFYPNTVEIKTKTVYRDAVTGKFVSKQYVEDNPNTTFKSKIKNFFGM